MLSSPASSRRFSYYFDSTGANQVRVRARARIRIRIRVRVGVGVRVSV